MWSIAEVARESGVTSRALRHYDAIGLLPPAHVADNGWRYYGPAELLRLQQILLLRNLGLGLDAVREVLARDSSGDRVEVLEQHHAWLLREQDRLARLATTVQHTIESIQRGEPMAPDEVFAGFEHNPYEQEARERWGDEVVDDSKRRLTSLSAPDAERTRTGYDRVHVELAPLLAEGVPVTDPRVQELVQLHYEVTSLFWTPNHEAYLGLGQMYVDDERFRASIGGGNDALVDYLRDAMHVYADAHLAG